LPEGIDCPIHQGWWAKTIRAGLFSLKRKKLNNIKFYLCFAFIVSESGKKEIKKTYKKKTWTTADQKQELRTCGEFNATGSRANESGNYKSILFRF
jgi:hypothetical protein